MTDMKDDGEEGREKDFLLQLGDEEITNDEEKCSERRIYLVINFEGKGN